MNIRFCGMDDPVEWTQYKVDGCAEDRFVGRTFHMENRIEISHRVSEQRQREALLHEIIHVVENAMRIDLSEKVVSRLGMGLFAALTDNLDASKYILGIQKRSRRK